MSEKIIELRDWFAANATEEDISRYLPKTSLRMKELMISLGILPQAARGYGAYERQQLRYWARFQHADAMMAAREAGSAS